MSNNHQIVINQMIIHKVDHRNYDAPQLSDLESPISEEVASFLRKHIDFNREHKYARSAVFTGPPENQPVLRTMCDELIGDPGQFVAQSQAIARHLFETVKEDKRVSPGDLTICTFTEGDDDLRWLALLKMDPADGFVGEREIINGQVRIVLHRVPDVLPTGELQKCAFILPPKLREQHRYDLRVLDQQAARFGVRQMVASFFVTDFLQCQIGLNRRDKTLTFLYGSNEWIGHKKAQWSAEDIERFRRRAAVAIQDNMVDVADFAEAIISKPEEQEEYLEFMRCQGLKDLTFETDPDERQRLTQYLWFEGDHGLQIRIEAEAAIGPDSILDYKRDEATNVWTVTIRTTHWEEMFKKGRR
jgi:nucleoid-associated protein YejK